MSGKLLTIFTPTYNRAYILSNCYTSLKRQTCKDFEWLVIDDGSSDETSDLINKWIKEKNEFKIRYIYQENQGMHGAHNTAYENISTELNICIDSDDYMPDDAVYKIKKAWEKVQDKDKVAGLVGLDAFKDGQVIGQKFTNTLKRATLFEINNKYKIDGDKKLVYRTELTKKYPYPIFKGEKYVGLAYKYYKIDEQYELELINDVLCIVEYMEDGSSKNMIRQYVRNPKGFCFYRIENMKLSQSTLKFKVKQCIHYVSSSMFCKNKLFIKESPEKLITLLCIPIGILLNLYINYQVKRLYD